MSKRKPVFNVHCHLLNFRFVPDKMTKLLAHIPEDIADDDWFGVAAGFLFNVIPGPRYNRIRSFLKTYKKSIHKVAQDYVKKSMKNARIDICVPLMMDLEQASREPKDVNVPYYRGNGESQISLISEQVRRFPWRVFPFIMFDPRRQDADKICIDALRNKGFIGIKMYPALGYSPSCRVLKKTSPAAAVRLGNLYKYCGDNQVPITAHASVGGAYSTERDSNRELDVWPLTEVSNWIDPILEHNLKINFAHLGGNYMHDTDSKRVQSATWRRQILNLIARSRNEKGFGTVFSDISFHDMALGGDKRRYFRELITLMKNSDYSPGILFGTDSSMISHTWSESDYIKPFRKYLPPKMQTRIFCDNPTSFLFDNARIPDAYVKFLKSRLGDPLPEKDWIIKKNGKYYIVT